MKCVVTAAVDVVSTPHIKCHQPGEYDLPEDEVSQIEAQGKGHRVDAEPRDGAA